MIYAAFSGNLEAVTEIILSSAKEAVQLGIGMAGVLAFWTGLMEIAQDCGLVNRLTRSIRPVIRFLFPDIPDGHRAQEYISLNMIAWRSQYGSSNPEAIVGPALLATACSTLTAVIYCKWKMRKAS